MEVFICQQGALIDLGRNFALSERSRRHDFATKAAFHRALARSRFRDELVCLRAYPSAHRKK